MSPLIVMLTLLLLLTCSWLIYEMFINKTLQIGKKPTVNIYYTDPSFLSPPIVRGNRRLRRRKIDGTVYSEEDNIWDDDKFEDYMYDDEGILLELEEDFDDSKSHEEANAIQEAQDWLYNHLQSD